MCNGLFTYMNFVFLHILYTRSYFTEKLNKSPSLFPFDFGRLS